MPAHLMRSITAFHLFIYTIIKERAYKQTPGGDLSYKWRRFGLVCCSTMALRPVEGAVILCLVLAEHTKKTFTGQLCVRFTFNHH